MAQKAILHYGKARERARSLIEEQGGTVLADYGQSFLIRIDGDRLDALTADAGAGLSARPLPEKAALRAGAFAVEPRPAAAPTAPMAAGVVADVAPLPSGRRSILLDLAGPMHPDWKAELERRGVVLYERLDDDTFLASVDPSRLAEVADLPFVEAVAPYSPALKVNPEVLTPASQERLAEADRAGGLRSLPLPEAPPVPAGPPARGIRAVAGTPTESPATLEVVLFDEADMLRAIDAVRSTGAEIVEMRERSLVVAATADELPALAAIPEVKRIDPFAPEKLHNNVATGLLHADVLHNSHGLSGAGQIVGIADSGLDNGANDATLLDDFEGRLVSIFALGRPGDPSDPNGHGTHVAGSVLGDGSNSNGTIRGTAPAAQLVFQSLMDAAGGLGGIPLNINTGLLAVSRDEGARIHTNSWGADVNGVYNTRSTQADTFAFSNREVLVLFSAGNAAPAKVGSPGTAKNVLTVGASESVRPLPPSADFPASPEFPAGATFGNVDDQADNANHIASFSSIGPAQNNRRKPDVVAPGSWILSTRSSVAVYDSGPDGLGPNEVQGGSGDEDGVATHAEAVGLGLPGQPIFRAGDENTPDAPPGAGALATENYMYLSGTSMATPLTAGSCALLRQYLLEQRGHTPSAALLKAIVVNGAVDMGMGIPHTGQGWGRVDLTHSLFPAGTGRVQFDDTLDNAVATGDIRTYDVHVPAGANPLAVTLVWRDPAGATIQNRLHLRVTRVATATVTTADPIADIRNNVQKVVLTAPAAGQYTIEVEGVNVATGVPELLPALRQDFALVVAGATGFSCNPSDIVQVIDRSGSMGFSGYMEPAKERAKQMVDLLQINDQAGVVRFDSAAAEVFALTLVDSEEVKDDAHDGIDLITSGGNTDLREGLERGLTTLGPDTGRPRAIVFLSDGFHTVATPAIDDAFLDSLAAADVKVYTVALGPDSDFAVLNNIAFRTGTGAVRTVESAADLHKLSEIYYDILGGIGCGGVIHLASSTFTPAAGLIENVSIAATTHEAHFALSWTVPGRNVDFRLESPTGTVYTPTSPEVFHFRGSTHQFYRVANPRPGTWKLRVRASDQTGAAPFSLTRAALADADVRLIALIDPRFLIKGQILLTLRAEHANRPLVGRATASITFPTVSIPDLLLRHAADLKKIKIDKERLRGDDKADTERFRLGIFAAQQAAQGRDIFERKTVRVELADDGRNQDPKAGDGIYTAFFDPQQAGAAGNFSIRVDFEADHATLGRYTWSKLLPVHVPEASPARALAIGPVTVRKGTTKGTYRISTTVNKPDGQPASPTDKVAVEMSLRQGLVSLASGPTAFTKASKIYSWSVNSPLLKTGNADLQVTATRGGLLAATAKGPVKL